MATGIAGLIAQWWQTKVNQFKPKGKRDWFFLRERWNLYSDEMREIVLAVAKMAENQPIERYSDKEKRAIATAIALINAFAEADQALISQHKAKWEKLYEPD